MIVPVTIAATLLAFQGAATDTSQPVIDNDRVTVWSPAPSFGPRPNDAVMVSVTDGQPGVVNAYMVPAGSTTPAPGAAINISVGGRATVGPVNGAPAPARTLRVEIKKSVAPLPNNTGFPDAFPRPGITQVLDNDRVTVWDYRWTPGQSTPMHFHTKDVVVMFLEDGALISTLPDGTATTNPHAPGDIRFNRPDRTHTETLPSGRQRALIIELK